MKSNKERFEREYAALRERFENYLINSGKSEAQVAKAIGKSQTAVNQWRHDKYHVSRESMLGFNKVIKSYLIRMVSQRRKKPVVYCPTTIGEEIVNTLRWCHDRADLAFITGTPGKGKTEAIKKFVEDTPGVISMSAFPGWSPKVLVCELLNQLKLSGYGNPLVAHNRIVEALTGTDRLIIIDESHFLTIAALEKGRIIAADHAKVGIVYVGQPYLLERFTGPERKLYWQLIDRGGLKIVLSDAVYIEDVELIAKSRGITNQSVIKYLYKFIKIREGSFRVIQQVVDLAREFSRKDAGALAVHDLKEVEHLMIM